MCSSRIAASAPRGSGVGQVVRVLSVASEPVGERQPLLSLRSRISGPNAPAATPEPSALIPKCGPSPLVQITTSSGCRVVT